VTWVFEAVSTRWFLQHGGQEVPAAQGTPQALVETALDGTQEAVPGSPNGSLVSAGGVSVQDVKKV